MQVENLCVLAHDLNNKLSIIIGNCDLILQNAEELSREAQHRIERIKGVALGMVDLIKMRQCPIGNAATGKTAGM